MLYRIHEDDRFLGFLFDSTEIRNKLGRANPIHIKRAPISYREVWPDSLLIKFVKVEKYSKDIIPDVSVTNGRLFFSDKAHDIFNGLLNEYGDFLPVHFDKGTGFLFNPLITAESLRGLDERLTLYDKYNNLASYSFVESVMDEVPLFRTALDVYLSIYCNESFKTVFEAAGLIGVSFGRDVCNALSEMYGVNFNE